MYIVIGIDPEYNTRFYKLFSDIENSTDILMRCLGNKFPNCEEIDDEEEIKKVKDGIYYHHDDFKKNIKVFSKNSGWVYSTTKTIYLFSLIKIEKFVDHTSEIKWLLKDFRESANCVKPSELLI